MKEYPFYHDAKNVRFIFDDKASISYFKKDIELFHLETPAEMLVAYLINNRTFSIFINGIYCPNRYRVYIKGEDIYYAR